MTSNTGPCSYHGTVTSRTPPPSSCSPTADPLQADTASTGNPPTVTKTKFFTNVVRSLAGQRQKQQRSPATGAPAANAAQRWEQESDTKQHNREQQRFAAEAHEARIALDTAAQAARTAADAKAHEERTADNTAFVEQVKLATISLEDRARKIEAAEAEVAKQHRLSHSRGTSGNVSRGTGVRQTQVERGSASLNEP